MGPLEQAGWRPGELMRLEWVCDRLLFHGDPLPMAEQFPVGRSTNGVAVSRGANPAERDVRLVSDGLVVNMQQARMNLVANRERTPGRSRNHACGEAVFA